MPGPEFTPQVTPGRQLIQGYGDGGFRVAGRPYRGSIIVFPTRVESWGVTQASAINEESLASIRAATDGVQILLVGCGTRFGPPPAGLGAAMRAAGLALEWMDTGAACRTFNVLLAEDRQVAAALIAVD